MIARLRRRHRVMTLGMALAAPAVLVAGVMARPDWEARLGPSGMKSPSSLAEAEWSRSSIPRRFRKAGLQLTHRSSLDVEKDGLAYRLRLERLEGAEALDYWLYATDTEGVEIKRLPQDARLLGTLEGTGPWAVELGSSDWPAALVLFEPQSSRVADVLVEPGAEGY